MAPLVADKVEKVMETAVRVMGFVMELIVKPVAVPALRADEKALLTVRVFAAAAPGAR